MPRENFVFEASKKTILLTKGQLTYNKLETDMNKLPSNYNVIKSLVKNNGNNIEKISNNS